MNFAITVTLGAGDKGRNWDALVRQAARKNRMSVGAFVRSCIRERLLKDAPPQAAAAVPSAIQNDQKPS